jgi:N-acetylglucosamine-6-phosphate deacetylase
MKDLVITRGKLITPARILPVGDLLIKSGKIVALGSSGTIEIPRDSILIDANGLMVVPGFIDAHTHGGMGHDFMDSTPDEIRAVLRWLVSTGVTTVLPTLASAPFDEQIEMVTRLRKVKENQLPGEAAIAGLHLEGPYLRMERRGAQPEKAIRKPSVDEMKQLIEASGNNIRLVTLAPELTGALDLIGFLAKQGIVVSAGHSEASVSQIREAVKAGLTRAAHLYNGMMPFSHRTPGIVGAVLTSDEIYAELTLDGIHVDPVAAEVALRAKGLSRITLVTDATQATGLGDGTYIRPGNRKIIVKEGAARLESGNLAGSVLTMDQAVRNAVHLLHLPLTDAIAMASQVSAASLGLGKTKGTLACGMDGDVVLLGKDLEISATIVAGEVIFQA